LPDDLLLLTDKMTMAASIECRAPFMDAELVALTSRMPSGLKIRGFSMKYLMKKVFQPWLPPSILQRKKRGFGAPVGSWFRKDLDFLVHETLSVRQILKRGIFDPQVVQEIISAHRSQRSDHTDHLLALISLELWSRIFLDGLEWQHVHTSPEAVADHP
jgi:asparagine synthase (glutamine-hydrolysing)